MKLVVDTNILFAALVKDSMTRNIILHLDAEFLAVHVTEVEIKKYKELILKKSQLEDEAFELLFEALKEKLSFIKDSFVSLKMEEAYDIMKNIDPKDSPFLAAAMVTNADIWSDDKHFDQQNKVKVWKTKELLQFL